jgi:hypothetical protein
MVVVRSAPPRSPQPLTAASLAATATPTGNPLSHRLNMELDLQGLFGLLCTAVLIGRHPATYPLLPPHLGSYARALLVSQERRHLFVSLCFFHCCTGSEDL